MVITPMLMVRGAAEASDFYQRAFGPVEVTRAAAPSGHLVVELSIDDSRFFAVDENPDAFNLSPESLGGTSVRVSLVVADPDAVAARAIEGGGRARSSRWTTSPTGCDRVGSGTRSATTG